MDLNSKYVQIKTYGQVLYEEFPVIHEKGLNYFYRKHPQLPFLVIHIIWSWKNTTCAHTQTKQKGKIIGMKFCKYLFSTDYTRMIH